MKVRLKEARLKSGMTQQELAYKSGISRVTIVMIENNYSHSPNFRTINRLARALSINPRELVNF